MGQESGRRLSMRAHLVHESRIEKPDLEEGGCLSPVSTELRAAWVELPALGFNEWLPVGFV